MNIDRLIDRIEKALREGATDPVLHSLAKEYEKFRTTTSSEKKAEDHSLLP